jgi:DNA repair exonuclease SbcCD ATPase subunit
MDKEIRTIEAVEVLLDELKDVVEELNEKQEYLEQAEKAGNEQEAEQIGETLLELEDLMENLKRKITFELASI